MAHRLNLEIGVKIAKLGADSVGFFLQSDKQGVCPDFVGSIKEWVKQAQTLDFGEEGEASEPGLIKFCTRLLVNLNAYKNLQPGVEKWNNVIPYDQYAQYYGRNFVISTGRSNVLFANLFTRKNFDPQNHYQVYSNVSPTEQIFFSLHPLVSTPLGVFDILSRNKVSRSDLLEIQRIRTVGFVKIVLYYQLTTDGACQLSECHVDGLRIPVE